MAASASERSTSKAAADDRRVTAPAPLVERDLGRWKDFLREQEALCAQHGLNLLTSEAFARAATRSADRLVSIGRFVLRGVRTAQSIYTLEGS